MKNNLIILLTYCNSLDNNFDPNGILVNDKLKEKADDKGLKVLGVPVSKFTKGQLSAINALIKQAQKNS